MHEFTSMVLEIVSSIPKGKVMTYGDVAATADSPRSARQVARILHSMSDAYNLPWHRVINKQGKVSLTGEAGHQQKVLLKQEGLVFINGKIDLDIYRYSFIENK